MSASTASFQKTVNYQIAPGQPGDRAGHGPECVRAYMATTETVPGTFVINVDTSMLLRVRRPSILLKRLVTPLGLRPVLSRVWLFVAILV